MAVTAASVTTSISATETVILSRDCSADPSIAETTTITNGSLGPGSTPPITQEYCDELALVAGANTIDLTALPKGALADLDLTGLKVRAILINAGANSAVINVAPGAANGYDLFGASNDIDIPPKGHICMWFKDGAPLVAVADAEIDVTSADTDATYHVQLLAG